MDDMRRAEPGQGIGTFSWKHLAAVLGPGIVAMLADTDAGSLITASQSGAQWGYRLLWLQVVLVPVLFMTQELTVRLGAVTGKSHGTLIRDTYGRFWAYVAVLTLVVACVGALLTEMGGLAGIGAMLNIPPWITMAIVVVALTLMAVTGSFKSVERIALGAGAFEVVFVAVAIWAHPKAGDVARQIVSIPVTDGKYMFLVSANIGAVIMPWMVFFQQSSVVEKGMKTTDIKTERVDTAIGAVVTQGVMAAVVVACAAALQGSGKAGHLDTVQQISDALTPVLGEAFGRIVFGVGFAGAAIVAAIVVTLTAARELGELLGFGHTLDKPMGEAPWFYVIYAAVLVAGAAFIVAGVDIVSLAVGVQVLNALLLPIVLGFLYLLARRLPEPFRITGAYHAVVAVVLAVTVALGLYSGIAGLWS
ncbi:Nramp family divalent metal transporter [Lichenibacterium minor]|jgi:NRAMP (natural resistance-associated macrophage protein)-like metal ion transporter|uniref:Nramp family divalent metal transporter n=1 Tax=Lichenibacterium minor TaxID=2316528 RepID=UPI001FDFAA2C|nr:Nramp family divalent metal transporter [Lichenibacterium minor]